MYFCNYFEDREINAKAVIHAILGTESKNIMMSYKFCCII